MEIVEIEGWKERRIEVEMSYRELLPGCISNYGHKN